MTDRGRQQAHETPLGHLQRHRSRRGTVIRFHRYRAVQAVPEAPASGWGEVGKIISQMLVIALVYIAVMAMVFAWGTP